MAWNQRVQLRARARGAVRQHRRRRIRHWAVIHARLLAVSSGVLVRWLQRREARPWLDVHQEKPRNSSALCDSDLQTIRQSLHALEVLSGCQRRGRRRTLASGRTTSSPSTSPRPAPTFMTVVPTKTPPGRSTRATSAICARAALRALAPTSARCTQTLLCLLPRRDLCQHWRGKPGAVEGAGGPM